MKLQHIAFWSQDIDTLVNFYEQHWNGRVLFRHETNDFSCIFIEAFRCIKLEIMNRKTVSAADRTERVGYSHLSIEVDSKHEVDKITDYCIAKKIKLVKCKEQYDDGFYESAFLDPDDNLIEIAFVNREINPYV